MLYIGLCIFFAHFSDTFAFYHRGGERLDHSELQKGYHLFLSKHHEKAFLLPDEESVSFISPKLRDVLFLGLANWRVQSRAGGLTLKFSHLSQDTFSEQLSCAPRCFISFQALPLNKAHPFSTLNPPRLTLSLSLLFHVTQAITTNIGGEETK